MKNAHEVVITCNSLSAYWLRVIFCNDMIIVMLWIYDRQWKKALEKHTFRGLLYLEEHSDRKIHKQTGKISLKFRVNLSNHFSTSFYRIEVLIIVSEINYLNLFTSSI